MKDRIIILIKALNFTAAQFADEIGVQKSGISHIISGRNKPSLDFIQKILGRFPEISMEWLLNGKGPMMKGDSVIHKSQESTLFTPIPEAIQGHDLFSTDIFHSQEVDSSAKAAESKEIIIPEPVPEETENDFKSVTREPGLASTSVKERENAVGDSESGTAKGSETKSGKIEKIVFFYTDKTFTEYYPS